MTFTLANRIKTYWPWTIAAIVPLALFLGFYPQYLRSGTFFWICLLTLPLSMQSRAIGRGRYIFWMGLGVTVVSMVLPTTIGVYVLMCLILILLMESIVGRLNYTLLIHALLASPLFSYFSSLISFPIRLQLSKIVSYMLQSIGADVRIEGNMVQLGSHSFLVDEACAGMHMLGYGLLFGTIILSVFTKNKILSLKALLTYYVILLALIFLGNVVRITLLILFQIESDHWFHEGLGLLLYVCQILIPFYGIVQWGTNKLPVQNMAASRQEHVPLFPKWQYAMLCLLMGVLTARQQQKTAGYKPAGQSINLPGYQSIDLGNQIIKLQNTQGLIYIKPPVPAYRADHNPIICWQGSGYSFKRIEKWFIQDIQINHAELIKGEDKIYTAWWFESLEHKTGDQLEWRKYGILHNEDFYLINLTCNTKEELNKQLRTLLGQNIISPKKNSTS
ncbi:exosortase N [Reichenbachiella sp. 5M10]|uniref:exosortase N n=1 Tax=Reichenbachiella sp. 5M10 TaxID=1889772 RepID=UPI000C1483D7|nr:exosortase N [Reichenbachiella sp. 5M10]PIB35273.1 exosortase N [Reichenbachiella sp. 5M10]